MNKLTSRKFWITVITAAYFALMAMREQGVENTTGEIVCGILTAVVIVGYVIMESLLDSDRILEETVDEAIDEDNDEDDEVEVAG